MSVTKRRSNSKKNLKSKKSKNSKSHKHQVGGSRRMTGQERKGYEPTINTNSGYNTPTNNISNASRTRNTSNYRNTKTNSTVNSETYIEKMRIAKLKEQQMQAEFEIERQEQIIAAKKFALEKAREQKKLDQEEILMRPFKKWNPKTAGYQLYNPRTKTFI